MASQGSQGAERADDVVALADTLDGIARDIDASRDSIGAAAFVRSASRFIRQRVRECANCHGEGWVCENHASKGWPSACDLFAWPWPSRIFRRMVGVSVSVREVLK